MDFDAALIIRIASSVLWTALGVWLVLRGRLALGLCIAAWASQYVFSNLFGFDPTTPWPWPYTRLVTVFVCLVSSTACGLVVKQWVKEDGKVARLPLLATLAAIGLFVIYAGANGGTGSTGLESVGAPTWFANSITFAFVATSSAPVFLAVYAGFRAAEGATVRRTLPLSLGLALYFSYAAATGIVYRDAAPTQDVLGILLAFGLIGLLAGGWLLAAKRGRGRSCTNAALAILGAGLVGLLAPWLAHVQPAEVANDPTGLRGVFRTAGWLLLVFAILRYDVLELGLKPRTVNRGAIAALALAALFIAAQVMQNFLSAQYGLLTGGVIAGTVLFAANPVQRAIERATEGSSSQPGRKAASEQEQAYKSAVRLALRGGITRAEELELARIADAHGIKSVRAHELRDEVERAGGA